MIVVCGGPGYLLFLFFWIRLYRVLIIEYAVGELLHMVLIIVYHPQWF